MICLPYVPFYNVLEDHVEMNKFYHKEHKQVMMICYYVVPYALCTMVCQPCDSGKVGM